MEKNSSTGGKSSNFFSRIRKSSISNAANTSKIVLSNKIEKNEAYIKNLKRKLTKGEKSHSDTTK